MADTPKPSIFLGMDPGSAVMTFVILGLILTGPATDKLKFLIIGGIIVYFVVKGANAAGGGAHSAGH